MKFSAWHLVLATMGGAALAEPPVAGVGVPFPNYTMDEIVASQEGSCQYLGEPVVTELFDIKEAHPGTSYCFADGECSLENTSLPYIFWCRAVKGKCPSEPKDCYKSTMKEKQPSSGGAELSTKKDEDLKEFESCKYSHAPRTGFFKMGKDQTGWFNACYARVECVAKEGGEEPPTFVLCRGLAIVGSAAAPQLECPPVNECVNNRFRNGLKQLDYEIPDKR